MVEPRDKAEGWYILHDVRSIDWNRWNGLSDKTNEEILSELQSYLEDVENGEDGESGIYSVIGNKGDLLFIHIRPSINEVDKAQRALNTTDFSEFIEQESSLISIAEVGGYTNQDIEDGEISEYARSKLYPDIPDMEYVSFYPMSRRRDEEYNWYTLPLEKREELLGDHRRSGEKYAGKVKQIISGSIGLDDWEWGVTLFTNDLREVKNIVYEMRFDEVTSRYSEFGSFYTGYRLSKDQLEKYLKGESISGRDDEDGPDNSIREELIDEGVYAGQPHGEDIHAVVLFSEEDPDVLGEEIDGMRGNFEHYDTHVETSVYRELDDGLAAIVSLWDTSSAAETAAGYLKEMPGVISRAGSDDEGFETLGMFYTVKADYRDEFIDKFSDVSELLGDMDGHVETDLWVNVADENDTFISSEWESRDSAMEFFRGDAFRETVDWGRDVLADTPRHVFLE